MTFLRTTFLRPSRRTYTYCCSAELLWEVWRVVHRPRGDEQPRTPRASAASAVPRNDVLYVKTLSPRLDVGSACRVLRTAERLIGLSSCFHAVARTTFALVWFPLTSGDSLRPAVPEVSRERCPQLARVRDRRIDVCEDQSCGDILGELGVLFQMSCSMGMCR